MNPLEIRFQLSLKGVTQTDIANQCGVKQPSVYRVIEGLSRSKKIETRIALVIGRPLSVLWPQWHGPSAKKKRTHTSLAARLANARAAVESLESLANREAA